MPESLPRVWADRHSLLQVLLNLVKNSQRALADREVKELTISASIAGERVVLRVRDTGSGVASPERLFQPFQPGAEATGLGLYLSRGFVRAFGGDLRYEPQPACCCFALDLTPFAEEDSDPQARPTNDQDQNSLA
jgi:C4-dicarboxylate-specific signal transduction histidine kinase